MKRHQISITPTISHSDQREESYDSSLRRHDKKKTLQSFSHSDKREESQSRSLHRHNTPATN